MEALVQPLKESDEELRLFPDWSGQEDKARRRLAGLASLLLHVLAVAGLLFFSTGRAREAPRLLADLRNATPLIAPPAELTQKAPNKGKISKEINLEGLLPRPRIYIPPSPPSTTRPAGTSAPPLPEPPKIESSEGKVAQLIVPAPQIQIQEKPKLAFEPPGAPGGAGAQRGPATGKLAIASSSVTEAGHNLARGVGAGGLVVGDLGEGVGGMGEGLNLPPSPGKIGSSLELLSDPMGVDFRPYLIRILSTVRRNWFAVIPQSARLGRQGRVVLQFAISRDGRVPKLVIASPSGAEALDRAAVAGISASNPFPPLPAEFRGERIHLQFTFLYNMRAN